MARSERSSGENPHATLHSALARRRPAGKLGGNVVDGTIAQRPALWRTILIGRKPLHTLVRIILLVAVCTVLRVYVLWPVRVHGPSMMPTYRENQVSVVNHLAYHWNTPQRGDVVAIRFSGPSVLLMKRVVGLPGETIAFDDGKLLINGIELEEPYVKHPCRWDMPPAKLDPDEYFVVGDNRAMRIEDHEFGRAPRDRIMGKVLL